MRLFFMTLFLLSVLPTSAQGPEGLSIESKFHYRDSEEVLFPIPFPFPDGFLPEGQERGHLATVDPGGHAEISRISLIYDRGFAEKWRFHVKIDAIDKYERNPTSSDKEVDLDEFWIRYGNEPFDDSLADGSGWYLKLGKFGKFDRQDDRNLESYGLVSTAFNRLEDAGIELGFNIGRHLYLKTSYTQGNPIFFRDPNALAGDNGSPDSDISLENRPPREYESGFVYFYDADIEDVDFEEPELGIALGIRFGDDYGRRTLNLMAFHNQRDLQDTVDLHGTIYGGDLDLLLGVSEELGLPLALPIEGREKKESGANAWLYFEDLVFFGQFVKQDLAGLERDGWEAELTYGFDLPVSMAAKGKPFFSRIAPTIRYSEIDNDFEGNGLLYPAPSTWWDWRKLDFGINVFVYSGVLLTIEHSENEFNRLGRWEKATEFLATLSYRWSKN